MQQVSGLPNPELADDAHGRGNDTVCPIRFWVKQACGLSVRYTEIAINMMNTTMKNYHEYIIVGAGPAGCQMGYLMEQANQDYLILEANDCAGSFYQQYPRHGTLISLNKRNNWFPEPEFNMRHDWNSLLTHDFSHQFTTYSTELFPKSADLVRYLNDFVEKFGIRIQYNSPVKHISRETDGDKLFVLRDAGGNEYRCKTLLLGTGPVKPNIPDVEGIELAEGYEVHDIDPARFINKRVVVLGRGNSAFEVANHLAEHAAVIFIMIGNRMIKQAWNSHFVGDLRSVNDTILDMFQLKAMHNVTGSALTKLERNENGTLKVYYEEELPHWHTPGTASGWFEVDHVIRATGFKYADLDIFDESVTPEMDMRKKYPMMNESWESSVPGMYFIGTNMASRDKKAASGFIHGFRYTVRSLFNILMHKDQAIAYPSNKFALKTRDDLMKLGEFLVERFSTTSALYQMFGVLSDVLVLGDGEVEYIRELPVEFVLNSPEFKGKKFILYTLELGFHNFPTTMDALTFIRRNDPERPGSAAFLHPVFRYYDEEGNFVSGGNTRSSVVVRYDSAADLFDGDLVNEKPRNVILNFINNIAKVSDEVFPEDHFYDTESRGGFTAWAPNDTRIKEHGLPECSLVVGGPQVVDVKKMMSAPKMACK